MRKVRKARETLDVITPPVSSDPHSQNGLCRALVREVDVANGGFGLGKVCWKMTVLVLNPVTGKDSLPEELVQFALVFIEVIFKVSNLNESLYILG